MRWPDQVSLHTAALLGHRSHGVAAAGLGQVEGPALAVAAGGPTLVAALAVEAGPALGFGSSPAFSCRRSHTTNWDLALIASWASLAQQFTTSRATLYKWYDDTKAADATFAFLSTIAAFKNLSSP